MLGGRTTVDPVGECDHCGLVFWDVMARNGHNCPEAPDEEDDTEATALTDFGGDA